LIDYDGREREGGYVYFKGRVFQKLVIGGRGGRVFQKLVIGGW
jgi:hypothetical protein